MRVEFTTGDRHEDFDLDDMVCYHRDCEDVPIRGLMIDDVFTGVALCANEAHVAEAMANLDQIKMNSDAIEFFA